MKKPPNRRYSCRDCNHEFYSPGFREVPDADDPTIPRNLRPPGIPVVLTCPKCQSANIRGLANPDPFMPFTAKRNK